MILEKSADGHPAITFDVPHKLYQTMPGRPYYSVTWYKLRQEVIDWLKGNVGEGRFQINGGTIVFLEDDDRFHFVMRWR